MTKIKYFYATDPAEPKRIVTLAYTIDGDTICVGWACNRPPETKEIPVDLEEDGQVRLARAKFKAPGDQFSKHLGRRIAESRLDNWAICFYAPGAPGHKPLEKIVRTIVHQQDSKKWCLDSESVVRLAKLNTSFIQRTLQHALGSLEAKAISNVVEQKLEEPKAFLKAELLYSKLSERLEDEVEFKVNVSYDDLGNKYLKIMCDYPRMVQKFVGAEYEGLKVAYAPLPKEKTSKTVLMINKEKTG